MDIEVHPEKREFGFGKAMALPSESDKTMMKKSKSLHDTPEMLEDSSVKPKKGRTISEKLKRFLKLKRRRTDESMNSSHQLPGTSPSFLPNRTPFTVQTPTNPTSFGSPESPSDTPEEQPPAIKHGLDVDDIPPYVMRILDAESTGSPSEAAVRITVLSSTDSSRKVYSLSKKKKLGFFLSMGLPPVVVTHLVADGQAASAGIEVGSTVVEVSGVDCSAKTGREIRDLIHLGKVIRYSPSLGDRGRGPAFNQSMSDQTGGVVGSPGIQVDPVDEDTWEKMKQAEESIHVRVSTSKENNITTNSATSVNGSPLFSSQLTTKKNSPQGSPRPNTIFERSTVKGDSLMTSNMQTPFRDSPLRHSTPADTKDDLDHKAKKKLPEMHDSTSFQSSDEGTSPLTELPRASLLIQEEDIDNSSRPAQQISRVSSTSSEEGGLISHLPRARVSEVSHQNTTLGTLPEVVEDQGNASPSPQIRVQGVSGDEEREPVSEPVSFKQSPALGEREADASSKKGKSRSPRVRVKVGHPSPPEEKNVPSTHSNHLKRSSRQEAKRSPQPSRYKARKSVERTDEDDSDGIDEDDIVKSFEEAIASSPLITPVKFRPSGCTTDDDGTSPADSPAPEWLIDAAARQNTKLNEEESLVSTHREKQSNLKKAPSGSKKQLVFVELPLTPTPAKELKHSLSGELLALDSNFYVKKSLSKYDRAKSMEEGINLEKDTSHQSINIDANVRRKKSGLMVGKRTGHNTSRPSILDYGSSGGDGQHGGRRVSEDTGLDHTPHIHHSRSLSDELVSSVVEPKEPRPPKSPHLLGVNEGRSRMMLSKQRNRRKLSNKNALFLHTGESEKYTETKVDPSSPQGQSQTDGKTQGSKFVGVSPKAPTVAKKKQSRAKRDDPKGKSSPQEKVKEVQEDKFRNLVIEASWGTGVEGGPITRRSTYSARTSTATTAALVAQAAAKRSRELQQTVSGKEETDDSLSVIQRNKRFSSVASRPTPKENISQPSTNPPTVNDKGRATQQVNRHPIVEHGGSQTFQVPLRKVPQNERLWEKKEDPPWKSVAKAKTESVASRKKSGVSSKAVGETVPTDGSIALKDESIPKTGHVRDKLKLFSQMK
jgi:hypothetical protein